MNLKQEVNHYNSNIIDKEVLKSLNPCTDRYKNYLKHYKTFSGSIQEFLQLEEISYEDKIWVAGRKVDRLVLTIWSAKCAKSVLNNYEKQFPNDSRVRDCIEYIIKGKYTDKKLQEHLSAVRSAESAAWSVWSAWSTESAAESARSAARSAGSAVWSAESARSAESAAESAARSAAWSAGSAAWSAAESAARSAAWSAARSAEQKNILLLIETINEIK